MRILVFGRRGCRQSQLAYRKVSWLITQGKLDEPVDLEFFDVDTTDGYAEALLYEAAADPPVIIVESHSPQTEQGIAGLVMALEQPLPSVQKFSAN